MTTTQLRSVTIYPADPDEADWDKLTLPEWPVVDGSVCDDADDVCVDPRPEENLFMVRGLADQRLRVQVEHFELHTCWMHTQTVQILTWSILITTSLIVSKLSLIFSSVNNDLICPKSKVFGWEIILIKT